MSGNTFCCPIMGTRVILVSFPDLFPLMRICAYAYHMHGMVPEEDGTRHVINDFIWEMSIRTISTKVEDVSHKNL